MENFHTDVPTPEQPAAPHRPSPTELEKQRLCSFNPVDRSLVGEVDLTPAAEAEAIVDRARDAQRAYARRTLGARIDMGHRLLSQILKWRRELLELLTDETGKTALEARWELWKACDEGRHLLREATSTLETTRKRRWWRPHRVVQSTLQPRGVVLVAASAFEPLQTTITAALSALLAGNSVIVVADERSPLIVQSVTNIAAGVTAQQSLWTAWVGGRRLVDALADRVDAIISYGPPMMTRRLARRQGDRTIPVLGRWPTQNAMVVLSDADLDRAARAAVFGACAGGGRLRRALRRIYVHQSVADLFVDAVVEQMGTLKQGDADGEGSRHRQIGPLFESRDLERLQNLVDDACRSGARLVAGGRPRPRCRGTYFEPTLLTGVDESMRLWRESAPGPVVAINTVQAPADAARRIREIDGYGAVSIFSANTTVARNLAGRLQAPVVGINEVVDDLRPDGPSVQGTFDGPLDPTGTDRLIALSRPCVTVERHMMGLSKILEARSESRAEIALDAALGVLRAAAITHWRNLRPRP